MTQNVFVIKDEKDRRGVSLTCEDDVVLLNADTTNVHPVKGVRERYESPCRQIDGKLGIVTLIDGDFKINPT